MAAYQVRTADEGDVHAIASVALESWRHTYGSLYPGTVIEQFVSTAYATDTLTASIARDRMRSGRLFHVAVNPQGDVVAFSHVVPHPNRETSYELARIYAHPQTRGTGVGTALLQHLLDSVPMLSELSAWVERDNAIGRSFYERHSFQPVSEQEDDFYGHKTILIEYKLVREH